MHILSALVAGFLFGLGLAISGMTQPGKVLAFLDFTGSWDPSLAFVMGGALAIFSPSFFWLRKRRQKPVLSERFDLPTQSAITPRLALGAAIFGAGWGLVGFCPGTAIAAIPTASATVLTVVAGVLVGILCVWGIQRLVARDEVRVEADF